MRAVAAGSSSRPAERTRSGACRPGQPGGDAHGVVDEGASPSPVRGGAAPLACERVRDPGGRAASRPAPAPEGAARRPGRRCRARRIGRAPGGGPAHHPHAGRRHPAHRGRRHRGPSGRGPHRRAHPRELPRGAARALHQRGLRRGAGPVLPHLAGPRREGRPGDAQAHRAVAPQPALRHRPPGARRVRRRRAGSWRAAS